MKQITVTDMQGQTREVEINPGWSLMELLRENDYDEILAMCGGACSCATCHVHIRNADQLKLPPVEEDEEMLLMTTEAYDAERSRLSCQIPMTEAMDGMQVQIVEMD
ncbi:ferredoxin [Arenicella chitinivorans]|uniref:Ferredoxin n=1 Tax=Arenicella chitinivorans TaxID=1329800 RepID=A0A918VLR7_9GAMM|nr:2Fe-2S iron-sulfur cluster-binding protein [Arenicella chitinivorans]GHA07616.1 ferredoxin [Arenicella chitinivorans]